MAAADSSALSEVKKGVTQIIPVTSIPWARNTKAASMLSNPPENNPKALARFIIILIIPI